MRLPLAIIALLITLSVYSQDSIEYDNLSFSCNGEELQMEEIEKLTKRYKVGVCHLKNAQKRVNTCETNWKRNIILVVSIISTPVMAACTGLFGLLTWALGPEDYPGLIVYSGLTTIASAAVTISLPILVYHYSSKDRCLIRADKQYRIVAKKLNRAINAVNQ